MIHKGANQFINYLNLMNRFSVQAKEFYVEHFLTIKQLWLKPLGIAKCLVLIEQFQLLSLVISQTNDARLLSQISAALLYLRIYPLINERWDVKIAFLIFGFLLALSFIVCLLYKISQTNFQQEQKNNLPTITLQNEKEQIVINKGEKTSLNIYISIFLQIYLEIFRVPLQLCHFSVLYIYFTGRPTGSFYLAGLCICFLSVIFQLLISVLIDLHRFEYRIKNADPLGKYNYKNIHLIFVLQQLILISNAFDFHKTLLQVLGLLYNAILLIGNIKQEIYQNLTISKLATQIAAFCIVFQLANIIESFYTGVLSAHFILLFTFPLVSLVLQRLMTVNYNLDTSNQARIEKYARSVHYLFKDSWQKKQAGISIDPNDSLQMYAMVANHIRFCHQNRKRKLQQQIKLRHSCFCEDYFKRNQISGFDSLHQMKSFAKEYICQILEDSIIEKENTQLQIFYISFLIQIKRVPTQAIYEVIKLSFQQSSFGLMQEAIIFKLKYDALLEFSYLVKKNDLRNQKYIFKKVYQYEESIQIIKQNLGTISKQFKEWFMLILTREIDGLALRKLGSEILANLKQLEYQLQQTYRANPLSNEVDTLYNIFQKYVNYNFPRPKVFKREGQLQFDFMQSVERSIFDPGSCVIQITLLQPRGHVIRYTKSFQQAIGWKDEEIQDQNIKKFIPSIIANDHDIYLDNFVERGRINVIKNETRIILAKQKSQFIIPINTRLRIETSPTEFGATALITPVNQNYAYLMLNQKGQIEEISQNIFEEVFSKYLGFSLAQLRGLDFLVFCPALGKIWADLYDPNFEQLDKRLDCQIVLPNMNAISLHSSINSSRNILRSHLQKHILKQIESNPQENTSFIAFLHLTSLTTINLKLVIVEIQEYKHLSSGKISSRQILQIKQRTSQLINQNSIYNPLSSFESMHQSVPNAMMCDLELDLLIEEEKMINDMKNQMATINITSSQPLIAQEYQQNFIEERFMQNYNDDDRIQEKEDSVQINKTVRYSSFANDVRLAQLGQTSSVGSRQGSNPQSALRKQMKEEFQSNDVNFYKNDIMLVIFLFMMLGSNVWNFLMLRNDFKEAGLKMRYESAPFKLSYFYNEFIISKQYLDVKDFNFRGMIDLSIQVYHDEIQNLDFVVSYVPELIDFEGVSIWNRTILVLKKMVLANQGVTNITIEEYLSSQKHYDHLVTLLRDKAFRETNLIVNLIFDIALVLLFLLWVLYEYSWSRRRAQKTLQIFCTLNKDMLQDLLVQFTLLSAEVGSSRFKKNETDEELFETSLIRKLHRSATSHLVEQTKLRVGKRMKKQKFLKDYLIQALIMSLIAISCSLNMIASASVHNRNSNQLKNLYAQREAFSAIYVQISDAFASMTLMLQTQFLKAEHLAHQEKQVDRLSQLANKLQLFVPENNDLIYKILTNSTCNIFSLYHDALTEINEFDALFTQEACDREIQLEKGLSVAFQDLYYFQFQFLQELSEGENQQQLSVKFHNGGKQIQRLYVSYGLWAIVHGITEQISSLAQSSQISNSIILGFTLVITLVSMFMARTLLIAQKRSLNECKHLFLLFPVDKLVENAYLISYVQEDLKLNQRPF